MVNVLATDDNMVTILGALQAASDIAVDTETSGLDVRNKRDYCMGICFDVPGLAGYIPIRHREANIDRRWLEPLVEILRSKPLMWHNLKFDYHSLATLGIDPLLFKGEQFCSLIAASLVNEELYSKDLDALARYYKLGIGKYEKGRIHDFAKLVGYANVPAAMYRDYGSVDATVTRAVAGKLRADMVSQELTSVYNDTELPFNVLLYELESRGVGANLDFCAEKAERGRGRMATLQRELGLNPASPIELGHYLLDELGLPVLAHTDSCQACKDGHKVSDHTGKATFKKSVMDDYETMLAPMNNPSAQKILEYRGWQKAVTSLYEPVLERVAPDGRIRTQFHQHRTVTGRLSSSEPNLQQIPRNTPKVWNGDAKRSFNSGLGDDFALYGWDYSQVEFRLAAAYGSESILLEEFNKPDADVFTVLSKEVFGPQATPEDRHKTKNGFVYPTLYGAGLNKIAMTLGMDKSEVIPLYEKFKSTIPGVIGVSNQVGRVIEQRGYVKYWDGRRRHIRNKSASYKGFNAVCQGGSAQLLKQTMLKMRKLESPDCYMVLSVHDEITFIIKRDLIPVMEPDIIKTMIDWPQFGVTFAAEGKEWK